MQNMFSVASLNSGRKDIKNPYFHKMRDLNILLKGLVVEDVDSDAHCNADEKCAESPM